MPRVSRVRAKQNDSAIRRVSSGLMRRRGLRVTVADVMRAAGLTHGGFYGHFASKDALLAAGCAGAFAESAARWHTRGAGAVDPEASRAALIRGYLAEEGPLVSGCPIASLATDVSRLPAGSPVRHAFRAGLGQLIDILTALQPPAATGARQQALLQLCTMVGALVLAGATRGDGLSEELLASARRGLLEGSTVQKKTATVARPRRAAR